MTDTPSASVTGTPSPSQTGSPSPSSTDTCSSSMTSSIIQTYTEANPDYLFLYILIPAVILAILVFLVALCRPKIKQRTRSD
jgi:hypothetical protein